MKISSNIIKELQRGSEAAFDYIYQEYERYLYFLVYSIVKDIDAAKDVLQEVFIAVFIHKDSLRIPSNFHSWIIKLTKNMARNYVKNEVKTVSIEEVDLDEMFIEEDDYPRILTDVPKLFSKTDNIIVIYRLVYGISFKEIATLIGSTFSSVLNRYYRVVRKIRALYLEKEREKKREREQQ